MICRALTTVIACSPAINAFCDDSPEHAADEDITSSCGYLAVTGA